MIQAFVFIEAEPGRIQELVEELAGMKLAASVIKEVYAVTGPWDLIARSKVPTCRRWVIELPTASGTPWAFDTLKQI